jgi:hypothetical protein
VPSRRNTSAKGALVLVVAVRLDGDVLSEGEVRSGVLRVLAVGLALLRTIDAAQTDAFSMVAIQDFEGVAVEGSLRRTPDRAQRKHSHIVPARRSKKSI